jgi:hypothetical protein
MISWRLGSSHNYLWNWLFTIAVVSCSSVELVLIESNWRYHELLVTINFASTCFAFEHGLAISYIVIFLHKLRQHILFLFVIET